MGESMVGSREDGYTSVQARRKKVCVCVHASRWQGDCGLDLTLRGGLCEAASCQMAEMGEQVRTCGGLGAGHGSPKRDPYPYPWVPAPVTRMGLATRADP